jgi:ABC-type nitrate/sulfonate/bicarbonate transport system substrate-binding protein
MSEYHSIFNPEDKLSETREWENEKKKSYKKFMIDYDKAIKKIDENIKKHEEIINKLKEDKDTLSRYKE